MKLPSLKSDRLPSLQSNTPTIERTENYGQGRGGRAWRNIKRQIHERDQWTCCKCGIVTMNLECDHIINKAEGGTDDVTNLQSLCVDCHKIKSIEESKRGMKR